MKKGDIKHPINPSPNSKMSPYSPSSSNEQQTLQSSSQNILVLKKYKLDNLNIPSDTKDNSPSLSRSLKTPLSSNLISNNLLHSIKSKKLNQTESIQPIDDKKIILPSIDKSKNNVSITKNRYELNTIKENNPVNSVCTKPKINENQKKDTECTRINPKLQSVQVVTSKYSIYARDNQSTNKYKSKERTLIADDKDTKKVDNNTVSPNKVQRSDILSEEAKIFKVRKLISEHKIIVEKIKKIYTYVISSENNGTLIKKCMSHRRNWKEAPSLASTNYNFKWVETSAGLEFHSLNKSTVNKQIVNHFEFHPHLSNKLYLFLNMMRYCEDKGLDVFKYLPMTIVIQYDSFSYHAQMQAFGQIFSNIKDYVNETETVDPNKFKKYCPLFNLNCQNYIKNNVYLQQIDRIGYRTSLYIKKNYFEGKNFWLVKAIDLNRGRCIKIGDSISKIQKLIQKFYGGICREFKDCENDNELKEIIEQEEKEGLNDKRQVKETAMPGKRSETKDKKEEKKEERKDLKKEEKKEDKNVKKYRSSVILLQKYLEKPLLYWGRKFDIRMWVLLTQKLEVYIFREGHLKTCSVEYNINQVDSFVHLTNYSVQKYCNNFSKFEIGNEVSFSEFQKFLDLNYAEKKFDVQKDLLPKMNEIIKISMKSVAEKINDNQRKYCFEIFGYDFILDSDFNLYLLEINTNPGLEESSPLINKLVPRMIDDALRLTIDDVHNTKYNWESEDIVKVNCKERIYHSPYPVDGITDEENVYTYVCSLMDEKKRNR